MVFRNTVKSWTNSQVLNLDRVVLPPKLWTMFKDHFSQVAKNYARFRPKAPEALYQYLVSLIVERKTAWDVGTGSGQAAEELAKYFEKVIATDASQDQIQNAVPHAKIRYEVSKAESSGFPENSVDLINVAQAIHWFDLEKLYNEVRRVGKKGSVLVAWSYGLALLEPKLDAFIRNYYENVTGPYWPPERKAIDEKYLTLPFPFREVKAPEFSMVEDRTFEQYVGYIATWSGTQRAIKAGVVDFEKFSSEFKNLWGEPSLKKKISWPIGMRVGYVD